MVLPYKMKKLAEEFRRGIASALGVKPEDINPEIVEKWTREWARAFLTPEAFRRIFGHYSPTRVEKATEELFIHLTTISEPVKVKRKWKGI